MVLRGITRYAGCVVLGSMFLCSAVFASSLQVSPVLLNLQARQAADGLWLSNSGSTPLQAQVRVFRWTQDGGDDTLSPTTDMVASPPMISIDPGQRQLIRVIRINNGLAPSAVEQSFRVVVDEIPAAAGTPGVQFALRYSIPVFLSGLIKTTGAVLDWRVRQQGRDVLLQIENTGSGHAQISDISFTPNHGKTIVLSKGLYGYVLAKNVRDWKLKQNGQVFLGGGVLSAKINQKAIRVSLPPASRTN